MSWQRKLAAMAITGIMALLYLPPIGVQVDGSELEEFLAPEVPHSKGTFIQTENHLYYRTLLKSPVSPFYAWEHYNNMRRRGVQWGQVGIGSFSPSPRALGWKVGMAREKALDPYTIDVWEGRDRTNSFPVSLRWPWLYVRLSGSILGARPVVLVPTVSLIPIPRELRFLSGAVVTSFKEDEGGAILDLTVLGTSESLGVELWKAGIAPNGVPPSSAAIEGRDLVARPGVRRLSLNISDALYQTEFLTVYGRGVSAEQPDRAQPRGIRAPPAAVHIRVFYICDNLADAATTGRALREGL